MSFRNRANGGEFPAKKLHPISKHLKLPARSVLINLQKMNLTPNGKLDKLQKFYEVVCKRRSTKVEAVIEILVALAPHFNLESGNASIHDDSSDTFISSGKNQVENGLLLAFLDLLKEQAFISGDAKIQSELTNWGLLALEVQRVFAPEVLMNWLIDVNARNPRALVMACDPVTFNKPLQQALLLRFSKKNPNHFQDWLIVSTERSQCSVSDVLSLVKPGIPPMLDAEAFKKTGLSLLPNIAQAFESDVRLFKSVLSGLHVMSYLMQSVLWVILSLYPKLIYELPDAFIESCLQRTPMRMNQDKSPHDETPYLVARAFYNLIKSSNSPRITLIFIRHLFMFETRLVSGLEKLKSIRVQLDLCRTECTHFLMQCFIRGLPHDKLAFEEELPKLIGAMLKHQTKTQIGSLCIPYLVMALVDPSIYQHVKTILKFFPPQFLEDFVDLPSQYVHLLEDANVLPQEWYVLCYCAEDCLIDLKTRKQLKSQQFRIIHQLHTAGFIDKSAFSELPVKLNLESLFELAKISLTYSTSSTDNDIPSNPALPFLQHFSFLQQHLDTDVADSSAGISVPYPRLLLDLLAIPNLPKRSYSQILRRLITKDMPCETLATLNPCIQMDILELYHGAKRITTYIPLLIHIVQNLVQECKRLSFINAKQSRPLSAKDSVILDRFLHLILNCGLVPRPLNHAGLLFEWCSFEEKAVLLELMAGILESYGVSDVQGLNMRNFSGNRLTETGAQTLSTPELVILKRIVKRHVHELKEKVAIFLA